jgi:hypothetical protein
LRGASLARARAHRHFFAQLLGWFDEHFPVSAAARASGAAHRLENIGVHGADICYRACASATAGTRDGSGATERLGDNPANSKHTKIKQTRG